ncbi:MAG: family 16 glycosylhydrolase, partial [Bacteroidota bacterium]
PFGKSTLLLFLLFILTTAATAQCPQLVWEDNFDGSSLDDTKWSHMTGDGCSMNLCGWGNNELEWYQSNNTEVSDGTMKIIAKKQNAGGKNYTSSRIRTKGKGEWTYGRFEASIKLPKGQGIWPAFWMLPTDEVYGGWPQSGEIDIMELVGSEPEVVHGTVHYGNPWPNNRSKGESFELLEGLFNDEFHEFAIEWEEGEIRWYVDDLLYSTITRNQISPWPFDQNFHFLLNVAVGGNWPGSPDGTTSFPQTMEVDYVRVYDGFFAAIAGDRKVANDSEAAKYQLNNLPENATIEWSVPASATIVSGQGTAELTVDWNGQSGTVEAKVTDACGTQNLQMNVKVESVFAKAFSFENFDDPGRATRGTVSGTFEDEVDNPASNDVNSSALVGKYTRDAGSQFDVIFYSISDLGDVSDYLSGDDKIFIDIYTAAPIGTQILLQMENRNAAMGDYPQGRHSRFEVTTTKQNEWERLEFSLLDQPDGSVSNTAVNQFVLLFAPGSNNGDVYYFDNFDSYEATETVSTKNLTTAIQMVRLSPNPSNGSILLENISTLQVDSIQLMDMQGKLLREMPVEIGPQQSQRVELGKLPTGTYLLNVLNRKGAQQSLRLVISGQ